jgi:polyisoprenoid-binding protein YceI
MKSTVLSMALLAASIAFISCDSKESSSETTEETAGLPDGTLAVDTTASEVMWKGSMVGMYDHSGDVKLESGNVTVADGKITGGKFVIDLTKIHPTDENYKEDKTPEKLVGHLASEDFFHIEQYPTATFEITGSEGSTVMGNLTVRGKTNPEKVENVVITEENGQVRMKGDIKFDRTKYDVAFKHPMQDMVISNDIEMNVTLVANK